MALAAATITKLKNRHGTKYLAQLTRKDTFVEGDATFGVVDESVLETANQQAREAVQLKLGVVEEDNWAVLELTPYFLMAPGSDEAETRWNSVFEKLIGAPAQSASTAVDPTTDSANDRRRYSGSDFEDDANLQAGTRPRRSAF